MRVWRTKAEVETATGTAVVQIALARDRAMERIAREAQLVIAEIGECAHRSAIAVARDAIAADRLAIVQSLLQAGADPERVPALAAAIEAYVSGKVAPDER